MFQKVYYIISHVQPSPYHPVTSSQSSLNIYSCHRVESGDRPTPVTLKLNNPKSMWNIENFLMKPDSWAGDFLIKELLMWSETKLNCWQIYKLERFLYQRAECNLYFDFYKIVFCFQIHKSKSIIEHTRLKPMKLSTQVWLN